MTWDLAVYIPQAAILSFPDTTHTASIRLNLVLLLLAHDTLLPYHVRHNVLH